MSQIRRSRGYLKRLFAILLFLCIAGCNLYSLVRSDREIQVGTIFKVTSPINWSKWKFGAVETWTIDGPRLQRLMFFKGVEDGQSLFQIIGGNEKSVPIYKSSMTPLEIMELIESSLARTGGYNVVTKDLRPYKLGGLDGFRFEFSYTIRNGLKYNGFVVGAKKHNRLLAIMYVGTALYHYEKHIDDAEKIVSSVVIL
ncbi:MAG: hypothetical protein JRI72_11490 [Deltaproteobacteria bacterium]|nr:hypothetical protein [Deltaproteobacteria bacterium]